MKIRLFGGPCGGQWAPLELRKPTITIQGHNGEYVRYTLKGVQVAHHWVSVYKYVWMRNEELERAVHCHAMQGGEL